MARFVLGLAAVVGGEHLPVQNCNGKRNGDLISWSRAKLVGAQVAIATGPGGKPAWFRRKSAAVYFWQGCNGKALHFCL